MKKIILAAIIALATFTGLHAQGVPAPEKFNDYLEQVHLMGGSNAEFLITTTMESLAKDPKAYRQMMELAERRFSDPADPIHDENLYIAVLTHAAEKYVLSGAEKEKQRLLLAGAMKNRVGSVAADFDYVVPKDKTVHHLKDLKANHILVYFNDPDCNACETIKQRLASSELINQLVTDGKLIVLAIYPFDDQKLWKKTRYPNMMINGWNQSRKIENGELYDLPTLPCFYLLDKDYKVLMKNEGSLNKVEALLKQLTTAPAEDPNIARSEQMLALVLENKGQELYDNMSDQVKGQAQPAMFDGLLSKVEGQFGKYQSHEPWEVQQIQGMKAYTSVMNFEQSQLGFLIIYDESGKMLGIQFVPVAAIKKN